MLKTTCSESSGRVNLLSDVWQNVSKEHLLGSQLSLFGTVGYRHDGIAIAEELEKLLEKAQDSGWEVIAVVTDDAGQCGRAR